MFALYLGKVDIVGFVCDMRKDINNLVQRVTYQTLKLRLSHTQLVANRAYGERVVWQTAYIILECMFL